MHIYPVLMPVALVSDPDGLQQVSLFVTTPETQFSAGFPELKTGRLLGGATNATIDLRYDGIIPSDPGATNLSTILIHKMTLETVDTRGNIRKIGLSLLHDSTHKLIIPLDRQKAPWGNGANGVAFSPDGKILASGAFDSTIRLWDMATQRQIGAPLLSEDTVTSVAFSPDGKTLVSTDFLNEVTFWDVEKRALNLTRFGVQHYTSPIGHELRRPLADYLDQGIYELRIRRGRVNYRILYFFYRQEASVLTHALTKEDQIPHRDLDRAVGRKKSFEANPDQHLFEGDVTNG